MKKTMKFKITMWFAMAFVFVSIIAIIALYSVSKDILTRDQTTNIQIVVKEFSKKLSFDGKQIKAAPGARFYEQGVYRVVLDENGAILQGELPGELEDMSISLIEDSVRENDISDVFYLEYDMPLSFDGNTYWVKGIAVLTDELHIVNSILMRSSVLICVLAAVAVVGAYILVWQVFSPVARIQKTAKEISESSDLSRRIQIGKNKDELRELANTFDDMLDRIEQTLLREKQFSADVSHELRTPITVILSECEYTKECAKTMQEYEDSMAVISRQADRMQKMVTELLMLSKMETHTISAEFETVDVSELLSFICEEQEEIQSPEISMERHITPGIFAKADRGLLARLFINLLDNAYRYSKENGTIKVVLEEKKSKIVFSVADNGIGIAEEDLPLIWDRFYRVEKSRNSGENNNMGLGLSMVKWIAEYHKGEIMVNSKLGEGSEFIFVLPSGE